MFKVSKVFRVSDSSCGYECLDASTDAQGAIPEYIISGELGIPNKPVQSLSGRSDINKFYWRTFALWIVLRCLPFILAFPVLFVLFIYDWVCALPGIVIFLVSYGRLLRGIDSVLIDAEGNRLDCSTRILTTKHGHTIVITTD